MSTAQLVGPTTVDGTGLGSTTWAYYEKWQATGTGKVSHIRVEVSGGTTNAKVALYNDNSGVPGTVVAKQDTSQALSEGWNLIPLEAEGSVTKDTWYWIALTYDTSGRAKYKPAAPVAGAYKAATPFSTWAWGNNPSDLVTQSAWYHHAQGYGILTLSPSSIATAESVQNPTVTSLATIAPSSIASAETFGTPTIELLTNEQNIQPTSIASAESIGSPTIELRLQIVLPTSISSAEAFGTPAIALWLQLLIPSSISSAENFGTPSIAIYGLIIPTSIPSAEAFGSPTITKVRWHVILDGKYASLSAELNKAYVISRGDDGINVYGQSTDSAELALVGERLDFDLELEIPTAALAASVAEALLARRRLGVAKGYIVIPPNCGVELWDVIEITNTPANQQAAKYRVAAIRFEYHPRQAKFQHKLILGAR